MPTAYGSEAMGTCDFLLECGSVHGRCCGTALCEFEECDAWVCTLVGRERGKSTYVAGQGIVILGIGTLTLGLSFGGQAKKGITVNGVAPALIDDTNMMGSHDDEEKQKRVAQSKSPSLCFLQAKRATCTNLV